MAIPAPPRDSEPKPTLSLADPRAVWAQVLEATGSRVLASVVRGCELVEVSPTRAVLRTSPQIGRLAQDKEADLRDLLARVAGIKPLIEFCQAQAEDGDAPEPPPMAEHTDPLVLEAARLFNARVVGVHPKRPPADRP